MEKIIFFMFLCAAVIFTGCRRDDDTAPESLVVTGSISEMSATKIGLELVENKLNQIWELGDHIVGSYTRGGKVVDIDYKVISISGNVATLGKVGSFIDPSEGMTVYALCLGQKDGENYEKTSAGNITGDIQNDYRTVMTAEGVVNSGRLSFIFENKSVVIGSESVQFDNSDFDLDLNVSDVVETYFSLTGQGVSRYFTFDSEGEFQLTEGFSAASKVPQVSKTLDLSVTKQDGEIVTFANFFWTVFPCTSDVTLSINSHFDDGPEAEINYIRSGLSPAGHFFSLGDVNLEPAFPK